MSQVSIKKYLMMLVYAGMLAMGGYFLWLCYAGLAIRYRGEITWGTVTHLPSRCSRYAAIYLEIEGKEHFLSISAAECRNGTYHIGEQVKVRWHTGFKEVMEEDDEPVLWIFLLVAVIGFQIYLECRKEKDKPFSTIGSIAEKRDRTRRKSKRGKEGRFPLE